MNPRLTSWLVAGVAFLLAVGPVKAAGEKTNFSQFAGKFTGTTALNFNGLGFAGPAALTVRASKDGSGAVMNFSGSVDAGGTSVPFSGPLLFVLKNVSIGELLFNIEGDNGGAIGNYRFSKNKIIYTSQVMVDDTPFTIQGTISSSENKRRQKIVFSYTLASSEASFTYTAVLKRRIKPSK